MRHHIFWFIPNIFTESYQFYLYTKSGISFLHPCWFSLISGGWVKYSLAFSSNHIEVLLGPIFCILFSVISTGSSRKFSDLFILLLIFSLDICAHPNNWHTIYIILFQEWINRSSDEFQDNGSYSSIIEMSFLEWGWSKKLHDCFM